MLTRRRDLLRIGAALGGTLLAGCAAPPAAAAARVLVVGGGFGGASAAKYIRQLSAGRIEVVLVEPAAEFVSCPMSNLVLVGQRRMADITRAYAGLASRHGVRIVRDSVAAIDAARRVATLAGGAHVRYDKLVLSPGVEMMWDEVAGLREASAAGRILQAWKGGAETAILARQIEDMPDGGVFAIAIPEAPYRCPPAPYERASLVADYCRQHKPRAKVLILDANEDVTSKGALFRKAWSAQYAGLLEYRPQHKAVGVDMASLTLKFEIQDDVRADVLNVLPPMRASAIAQQSGLANSNARWCNVHWLNFESTVARHVHVIGDAIQTASLMPKSGQMANSHARVVAAAIVAEFGGRAPDPAAVLTSTCYSFVDARHAMRLSSTHDYVAATRSFEAVAAQASLSAVPSEADAAQAEAWAQSIWNEMLA